MLNDWDVGQSGQSGIGAQLRKASVRSYIDLTAASLDDANSPVSSGGARRNAEAFQTLMTPNYAGPDSEAAFQFVEGSMKFD